MASRRAQVRASILVSKKVLFLGRWHTNEVTEDIMQHLRRNLPLVPCQKAKLKLSELGIFFGKRVVIGRTHDEFIPMDKIVQVVPDAVHTTVLLCLIKTGTKSVFDILVFRCSTEKDARESAEVFRRLRALSQNNNNQQSASSTDNTGFYTTTRGDLAIRTSNTAHLSSNGRLIQPQSQSQQQQQMVVIAAPSPQPGSGAEEQEEAILVVTPDPGAISPGNDDAMLSAAIHQQQLQRHNSSNIYSVQGQFRRLDESDAAFKRRMRQQVREALKRTRNRSDADAALLAAVVPDESDTADYLADSELDQVSLSDSITAQQRALNDKVSYIAEEVNRLRSVFETTLRSGATKVIDGGISDQQQRYAGVRQGRSTSSESERRSRSPTMLLPPNVGHEPQSIYYNKERQRAESPYNSNNMQHSPPLAPGEVFRRRHIVSESSQQIVPMMSPSSPTASGRSRRLPYVYRQSNEPDVLYVHTARGNGVRESSNDLVAPTSSPNRITTGLNARRSSVTTGGQLVAPLVRVNVPNNTRSVHSINNVNGVGNIGGTSLSKISRQRRGGMMQRSRSSQWQSCGSLAQVVSTNDLDRVASPEDDERVRRHRELAERIRQERQDRREIVRAQMGTVEREKWELGPEPLYLIRSDNKQHQDRVGGVKLYKARSVPNFLVSGGTTLSQQPVKFQPVRGDIVNYSQQQVPANRSRQGATTYQPSGNSNNMSSANLARGTGNVSNAVSTSANTGKTVNAQPTYLVAVQPTPSAVPVGISNNKGSVTVRTPANSTTVL